MTIKIGAEPRSLAQRGHREPLGFTLLELLVVMAIVAILAAMVLGAVARAKPASQCVTCINHLKQWGYAAQLYANDHEDRLPREAALDGINTWEMTGASTNRDVWYNALPETAAITRMDQYSQTPSSQQAFYSAGKIFHCPRARFPEVSATYPIFSLAMNSKLMADYESFGEGAGICKLGSIKVPVKTALFLDNGIPGEQQLCPFQAPYTGAPKSFANQFPGRHSRGGNIAFCDAHVLTLAGTRVVDMEPTSIFRGRAIYPPTDVIWCADPAMVP